MRTWEPRILRGHLLLAGGLLAGGLLTIVGIVIAHFPSARVPGTVVKNTGELILLLALLELVLAEARLKLREKPDDPPNHVWGYVPGVAAGAAGGIMFLATQGSPAALGARSTNVNSVESWALAVGLLYTLFYRPEAIRRKLPFEHASEQAARLVPAGLAGGAAVVTGSYMFALHFFNQPLARIPPGPLAASIVAVVALLTPLYQLIARACWRYGLADLLDPAAWRAKWSEVTAEITNHQALCDVAMEQSADRVT
jgi:hypothetical protein